MFSSGVCIIIHIVRNGTSFGATEGFFMQDIDHFCFGLVLFIIWSMFGDSMSMIFNLPDLLVLLK